jgi:hypothetical protein
VARIRERVTIYRILVEKSKETDNLEDLGSHRIDNIKMGFKEIGWEGEQGIVAGCCEYGNEPTVSVKREQFLRNF